MHNIDRVALIVAAILVVGGIAYAHLSTDVGSAATADINKYTQTIEEKEGEQKAKLEPAPDPTSELAELFHVGSGKAGPDWTWYKRPGRLVIEPPKARTEPEHNAPRLTSVTAVPDSDKQRFVFRLSVQPASNRNLAQQKLFLEMRSEDGEWAERGIVQIAGGEIVVDLGEAVEGDGVYGKSYAFRLRSEAESAVDTPLPAARKVLHSQESEMVFLPQNYYFYLFSAIEVSPNGAVPGTIGIDWIYWDFDSGEAVKKTFRLTESQDLSKGVAIADDEVDTGWRFMRIIEGGGEIEIKNAEREKRRIHKSEKPAGFNSTPWEAPSEEEADTGQKAPETNDTPKPPKDNDGGGGLFGDD